MELNPEAQYTVSQNKHNQFKAYGLTVSENEWNLIEDFTVRLKDISSVQIELDKIRTGNIIGFKEIKPNSQDLRIQIRTYRVKCVAYNNHQPTKLELIPPGKIEPVKILGDNIEQIQLFSIVKDHTIAHLFEKPQLTLASEL